MVEVSPQPEAQSALSQAARTWLLAWARTTMAAALAEQGDCEPAMPLPEGVEVGRGCFVTLHTRKGSLRGCIGTFSEREPLWMAVREMAIAAATRDPRFRPVTPDELSQCVVEISALTQAQPITPEAIVVGTHGLLVGRGARRGVLLPQVASEHGWDAETFLDQTCLKAGLPPAAWRDGSVTIEAFSAEVFGEAC